jgi:hypothetical protein
MLPIKFFLKNNIIIDLFLFILNNRLIDRRHIRLPMSCACVEGEVQGRNLPPREGTTGPEGAREGEKHSPATAWEIWASIFLAGEACSAMIGGRTKTPFVMDCGWVFVPRENGNTAKGKKKKRVSEKRNVRV